MRFGQLVLPVVASDERVDIALSHALLEQGDDHRGILGGVLILRVEHRLAITSASDRGNQADIETFLEQTVRQCPMAIAGRFKGDTNWSWVGMDQID